MKEGAHARGVRPRVLAISKRWCGGRDDGGGGCGFGGSGYSGHDGGGGGGSGFGSGSGSDGDRVAVVTRPGTSRRKSQKQQGSDKGYR